MGFHLVGAVYLNVVGTSPTAQAVLAYLAHRADDRGERKCFPSVGKIEAATHFKHSSIHKALNELRERELLKWKSGGRLKGEGGRALANEYEFHLPSDPAKSSVHQTDNAVSAKRTKHIPPNGQCIVHQMDTINQGHPKSHSSVITGSEAATEDLKKEFEKVAESWDVGKAVAQENQRIKRGTQKGVLDEAMEAAGVSDMDNKKIFASTLLRRCPEECLDVIWEFKSERDQGEYKGLKKPAAELNKRLAELPYIN